MYYTKTLIEFAKQRGAPDPEANAAIWNKIMDLLQADAVEYHKYRPETLEKVSRLLEQLTNPTMRKDIEAIITNICVPPD